MGSADLNAIVPLAWREVDTVDSKPIAPAWWPSLLLIQIDGAFVYCSRPFIIAFE